MCNIKFDQVYSKINMYFYVDQPVFIIYKRSLWLIKFILFRCFLSIKKADYDI